MKRWILLTMVVALVAASFACAPAQEAAQETGTPVTVTAEASAPTESPATMEAAPAEADADYAALTALLTRISTDYQPGTAGCSLRAAKLAGELLDWNAVNKPESGAVTAAMQLAVQALTPEATAMYGAQFLAVHDAAIDLTKDYALDYLESAGYTPVAYPYSSADVETLFTALQAGLGEAAASFLTSVDPQQPFAMDINGDCEKETVTVTVDEDKYTTDVTIAGANKTYTAHIDTALMFCTAYVGGAWQGNDGQTLFLIGDEASDDYATHIFRLHGGELQHGEIYGSLLGADADGILTIGAVVDVFGTYGGECRYQLQDGFTFSLCSPYTIEYPDGVENGRTITVICDALPVIREDGTSEAATLPKGTELRLIETDESSYAVLMDGSGAYYRVDIERHDDDWQWYLNGVPEEQCFEPLLYAG